MLLSFVVVASLVTTSSAMGYSNIFAHVHEKMVEEVGLINQLLKSKDDDSTPRTAFFPRSSSSNINNNNRNNNRNRRKESAKQRRSHHDYVPTMKTVQSFSSHDEEIIERLVELQN